MKTINIRSLLLGVLATVLVVTLTGSKTAETESFQFVGTPSGICIFNTNTKTLYQYRQTMSGSIEQKVWYTFKVADDGSSLTKKE